MPLLSLILLLLGLLCAWPLVRRWVLPQPDYGSLALVAGFGAGVGGLTLWMLLLGLLPGMALSPFTILLFPAALWAGWLLASRRGARSATSVDENLRLADWRRTLQRPEVWLWLAIGATLAVSLVHALYYPFVGEDEVSRYAYFARLVFAARTIPPEVNGYPLLLPLGYAYAFFLSGGIDEHLAKIASWAFAPATVGATYWLASLWAGRWAGLVAAFTLAVTRLFVDWSPMGYVDIPSGLYFALAGVFASLWLQRGEARQALMAGLWVGLAVWTKQSGFAAALSLGLIFLIAFARPERRRSAFFHGAAALTVTALIALPWYGRNVALGGLENAVPAPGDFYYQQARRLLADWIPFLSWAKDFGYGVVPLYLGGMLASLLILARSFRSAESKVTDYVLRIPSPTAVLIQYAFILPYLILWWNWFSYDPRFLLTILPFYAALVGLGFEWAAELFGKRTAMRRSRIPVWVVSALTAVVAAALVLGGIYTRAGGVYRLLTAPNATDQDKLLHYKPDVASTVAFLLSNAVPGRDRIYSMDARLPYYLIGYEVTAGYPTELSQLDGYEYLVAGSWAFNDVYPRLGAAQNEVTAHLEDPAVFELLYTSELGTVKVYRVVRSVSQAAR